METNSTSAACTVNGDCGTGVVIAPTVRDPNASVGSGGADVGYTGPTVAEIIDALAGVIEFSHLAQSLRTRINTITTLEAGFNNLQSQVVTDNSVMAQQLIGLRDDLTNAVAYINNQTNIQISEREALVNSVNQMVAQIDGGGADGWVAALQEESTVRAAQTGALFAEKTVKTDLAGNVAGYGLSSYADPSGAVSDFRVASDRFSLAPPAYVSPTPPPAEQMHDGKVWVDTSQGSEAAVTKWWSSDTASWSLTPVTAAQPFIYLTTPTTLPDGTVVEPGLYVNSASITKLRADQIDTRGLTIKNAAGEVIFAAGTGLKWDEINGTNKPEDGATRNVFRGNWGIAITYTYGDIVLDGGNGWRARSTHTSSGTNKPPASGTGNTWWGAYTIKGDTGSNGLDGLTIVAPNSSHTLPASSAGVVSSYTGSGTTIEVFDGSTAVNAVASINGNNQFTVGTPVVTGTSTISPGARTYSGTVATVAQHSAMSTAGTISIITYPITVRRSNGTNVNLSFQQTLSKSLAGANGQPTYTWIKYADSDTGTSMSDSPTNKKYIGVAVNKSTADKSGSVAADYTWSLIQGPKGDTGKGISTITNTYQASNSGTTVPTGTWSTTIPALSNSAMFLWNKEVITYTDSTTQTNHYMIGQKGVDGVNGVSLDSVIEQYQAGNSATVAPNGSWGTSIPALTDTNKFLWNKETFVYSDGTQDEFIKMIGQKGDKGDPGKDSISIDLSNDSHGIPCNIDGSDPVFTGATTTASVYAGTADDSANWTWTTAVSGVTISGANTRTVTITGMSADTGFVDFTAAKAGASTQTARFSVYKAKGGSYWIVPSVDSIKKSAAGAYTPTTVTFNSRMAKTDGTLVPYSGFFRIEALVGNTVQSTVVRNVAETSYAYTVPADITHVRASLYRAAGAVDLLDQETLAVVSDGATGASGQGQVKGIAFYRSSAATVAAPTGGTFSSPNPTTAGWSDGVPSGVLPLWQSTRMFTSDGLSPQQAEWTTPQKVANTSSVRYEFSTVNSTNDADWSTTALVNSLYMRTGTSVDGGVTWTNTAGVLIKGEVGDTGPTGPAGPAVVVLTSRTPSFTSTDGVLDSGQPNIVFTAVLEGGGDPGSATYSWTVTGVQTQPSITNAATLTLTAAQFGTATSAIVQCTVNGLSDQVAVHRLNKSTAAAGATVGADGSNLKTGSGVNMVFNGDYTDGIAGTYAGYYTTSIAPVIGHNLASHTLQGEGTAYSFISNTPAANSVFDVEVYNGAFGKTFPVVAGKRYEASAWLNSHRCSGVISVLFMNSSGAHISQLNGNTVNFQSGISTLSDLRQSWGIFTAPAGAVAVKLIIRAIATGGATPYLFFSRVYFGEAGAAQTEASPWSPGRGIAQISASNASTYIADAAIDTLRVAGNAITAASSASMQITAGTEISRNSNVVVYTAPANTAITVLVLVTGRTGSISGNVMNYRRLLLRWGFGSNANDHIDLIDTGQSPWVGDFISMSAVVTIPANESRYFSIRMENPQQNTTGLEAQINFFAAKR